MMTWQTSFNDGIDRFVREPVYFDPLIHTVIRGLDEDGFMVVYDSSVGQKIMALYSSRNENEIRWQKSGF